MANRWILHADLDAFYASVEQMDRPELQGQPVVVGGSPRTRGVVAAASYEARTFGLHAAMPMSRALRLCPQAVRVFPRFDRYSQLSRQVMTIFRELTPLVEPLSMDEAYLDVTQAVEEGVSPRDIGQGLRKRVKKEVGLNVTVGTSASKSVAKIASQLAKPDGLLVVEPGTEERFLAQLSVEMLWGVGPKTAQRLQTGGIATIQQLTQQPETWFRKQFGRRGPELLQRALGRDDTPVIPSHEVKSVSAETTFPTDLNTREPLLDELRVLVEEVSERLQSQGLWGKTITVKLRRADFTTFTRQATLPAPTDSPQVILEVAQSLLKREIQPGCSFRLIGAGLSNFSEARQLTLFPETDS